MSDDKSHAAGETESTRPAIGREVRRWRRTRGLTLGQVGEGSGLNVGYLSQIENEKATPSLEALISIAGALDIPAAWLLLDSSSPPRVVRAADRPRVEAPTGAQVTEVDGGTSRDVRILDVTVPAGSRTGVHAHAGDEHHIVLEGRWRLTQGEHSYELGPGDYLAWDASIPHDVENVGDGPARVLLVYARHGRAGAAAGRSGEPRATAE